MSTLPLKIIDCDGAPARVIAVDNSQKMVEFGRDLAARHGVPRRRTAVVGLVQVALESRREIARRVGLEIVFFGFIHRRRCAEHRHHNRRNHRLMGDDLTTDAVRERSIPLGATP